MATANPTAPTVAHSRSLDLPAVIAGSVNLLKFTEALARAGLVGRHDAARGVLVIEPIPERCPQCGGTGLDEDGACDSCGGAGQAQDAEVGMASWNGLTRPERARWLDVAGSAVPAEAWAAWKAHRDSTV